MKKSLLLALSAVTLALSGQAQAGTAAQNFNVTATLTSKCQAKSLSGPVAFGAYTAFGSATNTAPTATIVFECSRGLAPSGAALDNASGTLQGVHFTLALDSSTAGTLSTAGAAATASTGATADERTYVVTGTMASGQPGDVNDATTSVQRTLTVTY
jgi:hypothetical protein